MWSKACEDDGAGRNRRSGAGGVGGPELEVCWQARGRPAAVDPVGRAQED